VAQRTRAAREAKKIRESGTFTCKNSICELVGCPGLCFRREAA
jgi:hypothetical protein